MNPGFSSRGVLGFVLMAAGVVALFPGALPTASTLFSYLLLPAAVVLTLGTYLVGTDVDADGSIV